MIDRRVRVVTWSQEAILDALRAWADLHGRAPSCEDWYRAERGHPNTKVVVMAFGSFGAARDAAGLSFVRRNHAGDWTRQQVIDAVIQWRFIHGRLPRREEWDSAPKGWPPAGRVCRLFGSWSGGLLAAGYRPTHLRLSNHSIRARMSAITKAAA